MADAGAIAKGGARPMRRLPALRGWVLALYTLIWVPALLAAIAAPLLSTWIDARMIGTGAFYNLGMDYTTSPLQVGAVWGEAQRAGVRPGDRVVAIDGRAPASLLALPDQLARAEGTPVRIGLERAGRRFTVVLTQSRAEDAALYAAAGISRPAAIAITIAQILGPMLILTAAAILLFRKRRDPVAAMLSLSFLLICSLSHMGSIAWDVAGLNWLNGVLNRVAWPLLAAALMVFPSGRFDMKWIGPAFAFALVSMPLIQLPMLPYAALLYWLLGLLAAGIAAQVLRYRRLAPGPER
jgi:membrane-associated protease RseP (regulator of RpoE activity)